MKTILILLMSLAMYLNLNARVVVGKATFENINSLEIKESVIELADIATVVIPRNIKSLTGKPLLESIKVGDKATIELGYNDNLYEEFTGYVREIESDIPVKIHLDDEMYVFKKNSFLESWEKVTLKEILNKVASGYTIECPDLKLNKFSINNSSTFQVLMYLKQQYGLYSYLKDNTLHCGFAYDIRDKVPKTHVYEFKRNIKKNDLKYKRKEDYKIKIIAIANKPDGAKLKIEVGNTTDNDAIVRTLNFGNVEESELRKLASAELNKLQFDGYTGNITGFGVPRTKAGDALKIIDEDEPDREGTYLIESVKIRYGQTYFERINTLSYKI